MLCNNHVFKTAKNETRGLRSLQPGEPTTIGLIHWNPHWECFVKNPNCTQNAIDNLDKLLGTPGNDFANIIMFEVSNYTPPFGWKGIGSAGESCGRDWDSLFYNADLWDVLVTDVGCTYETIRSYYAAGSFKSKVDPGLSVVVVGAHYPQTWNASNNAYVDANAKLKSVFANLIVTGGPLAIILADTNTESPEGAAVGGPTHHGLNKTQKQLATDLGIWEKKGEPPAPPLYYGCCFSDGFQWQGDRIVSNFGKFVNSQILFDPAPWWANQTTEPYTSEFHKGIRALLQVEKAQFLSVGM